MVNKMIERILFTVSELGPRLIAGFTFLPCGLLMGYTFSAFVLERNKVQFIRYGPFIFGIVCAFIASMIFYLTKLCKGRIIFLHYDMLIIAAFINLIGSGFFFGNKLDVVGAFISFFGHGFTYISALSYLHIVSSKSTRSIFLSSCFVWYLLGISSAVSVIANTYVNLLNLNPEDPLEKPIDVYIGFAGLNISCCLLVLLLLTTIKVFDLYGSIDYRTCFDNDISITNSNGTIFDKRSDMIRRVPFFYVTKSRRLRVSLILIFTDAIYFGLFMYFMFWFSLNDAVRLTSTIAFGLMFWIILAGGFTGAMAMFFFSIKMTFLFAATGQIIFAIIGIIVFGSFNSLIPFWLNCFLFGVTLSSIKIALIETTNFIYTELSIFLSYFTQLIGIILINVYFVNDKNNSFFYSKDQSTLIAHGISFLIITSLLTILVSLQIPRTYKTQLFDIQYELTGIIFKKHQIEQLNVKYLKDGTIPTISSSSSSSASTSGINSNTKSTNQTNL